MRYWWVLSGREGGENIFDTVEERSLVAIGWPQVDNLHGLDFDAIRAKVHEFYPSSGPREGMFAGMLDAFANQIQIGDIVLTRNPRKRQVLIGKIAEEYQFISDSDHSFLPHIHKVEWLRTDISFDDYRRAFVDNGKEPAWGRQSVWNANDYAEEIDRLRERTAETDDDEPAPIDDGSDADRGLRFGLERELQDALKTNLTALELGLEPLGIEQSVGAGRADIVAVDREECIVVIELKAGTAQPDSIAQLLAYMGSIDNPEKRRIRGILVAHDFHTRVQYAARALPNVALRSYSVALSFSDAEKDE